MSGNTPAGHSLSVLSMYVGSICPQCRFTYATVEDIKARDPRMGDPPVTLVCYECWDAYTKSLAADTLETAIHHALDEFITECGLEEGEAAHIQGMVTTLVQQAATYAES